MKIFLLLIPKTILFLLILIGIIFVLFGLPGTWIIAAGAFLYSIFFDFKPGSSDFWVVFILVIAAILGELLEFAVSILGGKKMNVSTGAIIASIAGGIIGAIVGVPVFLIGSFLGLLLGTFLGAFVYELIMTQKLEIALQSASGVFFSRVIATFMKTSVAIGMGIYIGFKLF